MPRRFPPPRSVDELQESFVVKDATGQALSYVYFEDEPQRRMSMKRLSPELAVPRRAQTISQLVNSHRRFDLLSDCMAGLGDHARGQLGNHQFRAIRLVHSELSHASEVKSTGKIAKDLVQKILTLDDDARVAIDRALQGKILFGRITSEWYHEPSFSAEFASTPSLQQFLKKAHELGAICDCITELPGSNWLTNWHFPKGWRWRPTNYRNLFDLFLHVLAREVEFAGGKFTTKKILGAAL
jgi:hypothetical protein